MVMLFVAGRGARLSEKLMSVIHSSDSEIYCSHNVIYQVNRDDSAIFVILTRFNHCTVPITIHEVVIADMTQVFGLICVSWGIMMTH